MCKLQDFQMQGSNFYFGSSLFAIIERGKTGLDWAGFERQKESANLRRNKCADWKKIGLD